VKKPTPAPTGRKIIAQGKARSAAALGHDAQNILSPAGAKTTLGLAVADYSGLVGGIGELLETARRTSARAVNALMTATYWEIGRRIVEFEQAGKQRAEYGGELLTRLADDLSGRFGRGYSRFNLGRFRQLYLAFQPGQIRATLSLKFPLIEKRATPSTIFP